MTYSFSGPQSEFSNIPHSSNAVMILAVTLYMRSSVYGSFLISFRSFFLRLYNLKEHRELGALMQHEGKSQNVGKIITGKVN